MKKVSLFALALTLTTAQIALAETGNTCPKSFQGFHLGGNIGYDIGKGKFNYAQQDVGGQFPAAVNNDLGVSGVNGGVNVGYTHRFGNWGAGLEFVANWSNADGSTTSRFRDDTAVPATITGHRLSARLNNSLQVRANFLYVIRDVVAPKLILGWDNSSWKTKILNTETGVAPNPAINNSRSKRHNAFLWGCGVDFLASKHFIVGLEYTGTIANKKTISNNGVALADPAGGFNRDYRRSWKPQNNNFAVVGKFIY